MNSFFYKLPWSWRLIIANSKISKAIVIKLPDDPAIHSWVGLYSREVKITCLYKRMYKNVHSKTDDSGQSIEMKMPIKW